jgi:DNA-binding NarL/FixJ family response regulator
MESIKTFKMTDLTKVLVVGNLAGNLSKLLTALNNIPSVEVVARVSTGEQAINQYALLKPEIIFIDVAMRGMTGFETARWIKEQNKKLKIVICSNEFHHEFLLAVLSMKLDGYLPGYGSKPVIEETITMVSENLSYSHFGIGKANSKHLTVFQYQQLVAAHSTQKY